MVGAARPKPWPRGPLCQNKNIQEGPCPARRRLRPPFPPKKGRQKGEALVNCLDQGYTSPPPLLSTAYAYALKILLNTQFISFLGRYICICTNNLYEPKEFILE